MSLSRGLRLLKRLEGNSLRHAFGSTVQSVRNSGGLYSYRVGGYPPSKFQLYGANALGGLMWWWVLWHIWHEPGHITGEFEYPDPKKWTDEELGIPPDDAE